MFPKQCSTERRETLERQRPETRGLRSGSICSTAWRLRAQKAHPAPAGANRTPPSGRSRTRTETGPPRFQAACPGQPTCTPDLVWGKVNIYERIKAGVVQTAGSRHAEGPARSKALRGAGTPGMPSRGRSGSSGDRGTGSPRAPSLFPTARPPHATQGTCHLPRSRDTHTTHVPLPALAGGALCPRRHWRQRQRRGGAGRGRGRRRRQ